MFIDTGTVALIEKTNPPRTLRPQAVWWVIALSLAVIAVTHLMRSGPSVSLSPSALAQAGTGGGAGGVFAFTGELAKGIYGVYMVDVDAGTIWVYEYVTGKGCLRLAAGRNWRNDRYLEEFNVCGITPEEVETLVDEQRRQRLQSSGSDLP